MPGWQRNYLALLAQRDFPAWGLPAKPQTTERLFKMLAVANGMPWNASAIGQGLGLNYQTVNSYVDYPRRASPATQEVRGRRSKVSHEQSTFFAPTSDLLLALSQTIAPNFLFFFTQTPI